MRQAISVFLPHKILIPINDVARYFTYCDVLWSDILLAMLWRSEKPVNVADWQIWFPAASIPGHWHSLSSDPEDRKQKRNDRVVTCLTSHLCDLSVYVRGQSTEYIGCDPLKMTFIQAVTAPQEKQIGSFRILFDPCQVTISIIPPPKKTPHIIDIGTKAVIVCGIHYTMNFIIRDK